RRACSPGKCDLWALPSLADRSRSGWSGRALARAPRSRRKASCAPCSRARPHPTRTAVMTTIGTALPIQWARLRSEYDAPLRRGAWYRVLSVSQFEVVVDVHQRPVLVARPYVDVSSTPPACWTIIDVRGAARAGGGLGSLCAVCAGWGDPVAAAGRRAVF